jgi:hypothetical protein
MELKLVYISTFKKHDCDLFCQPVMTRASDAMKPIVRTFVDGRHEPNFGLCDCHTNHLQLNNTLRV